MVELLLLAAEDEVERVSDALMELDALSVSVEDADAGTADEQALFGEPGLPAPHGGWRHSRLVALFADEAAATGAATRLLAQDWARGVRLQGARPVAEQDWVRLTQSQFAPVEITRSFWIVPSWHEAPPGAETVIRLDPGLAFGTGTHPTTRMCLRWIAREADALRGAEVLDYGCGSGILAIGAARFGAARVTAVDIDPAAVRATLDNARANGVAARAEDDVPGGGAPACGEEAEAPAFRADGGANAVLQAGLPERAGAPAGRYAVVLANILASPLKLLAPLLAAHLAPGGRLVLAGILERQADELRAAYAPVLAIEVADREDGWVLMTGRRAP
jgi:ribosomal protein L11 methyltransferase